MLHTIALVAVIAWWIDLCLAAIGLRSAHYWGCLAGVLLWAWLATRVLQRSNRVANSPKQPPTDIAA